MGLKGQVGRVGRVGRVGLVGQVGRVGQVGPVGRMGTALLLLVAVVGSSIVYAADGDNVNLMVGRSTVLDTGSPIARVSLTSADVADALVTSANELLINGKTPGTISMFVWNRAGSLRRYEVVVQRDLARLSDQLTQLFPGESIAAQGNGKSIVLSGRVSSKEVVERAVNVAAGYVDKKEDIVTLLQVRDAGASDQVLLRVRFAEVSRSALTELGLNLFTSPAGIHGVQGRATTQQFAAPVFDDKGTDTTHLVFSDFLNFFLMDFKHNIGAVIKALQTKGLFQSLAEPNLVAESGKEASFLAGGEFPVPVAQASGGGTTVTVVFKEFGIRLNFTPTVTGDRVHLKVRPEVSSLDFNNAITLNGFRIPALSTRRTETEIELQNGQTFAIAGLINNTMNKSLQKLPGIGSIPILGLLFRSEAAQKDQTELVVMITPEILPKNSSGVTPNLPRLAEPYLPPLPQKPSLDPPPPAFAPPVRSSAIAAPASTTPAPTAVDLGPAAAAAKVAALVPTTRPMTNADALASRPIVTPAAAVSRPLSDAERAVLDRARKQEQAAAVQNTAKQVVEDRRKAFAQKKAQEKLAREQARRDAQGAKRQAEIDKKTQKSVTEAQARLKAAQAAYEADIAKAKKQ